MSSTELSVTLEKRFDCLAALVDDPRSKNELENIMEYSRSTLDRAIRDLREADLILYRDGVWMPTHLGRGVYDIRSQYLDRLEEMKKMASIIEPLPKDSPLGCAVVKDAEVHTATSSVPDAIMARVVDYLEGESTIRMITPRIALGFAEGLYGQVSNDDTDILKLIIPGETFEELNQASPEFVNSLLDNEDIRLYRSEIPFSFGLWIADQDHVGCVAYTDHGVSGLIVNDTTDSLEWADDQWEDIHDQSQLIFRRGDAPAHVLRRS